MVTRTVPRRGDLVWVDLKPVKGSEQGGVNPRPALVISVDEYNAKVGLCVITPVTSQAKGYPFEVQLPGGLKVGGVVLCDQVRCIDWRARDVKFADHVPEDFLEEVIAKLEALIIP